MTTPAGLSFPTRPAGTAPAILPGTHPVRLPGTGATYYAAARAPVQLVFYFPYGSGAEYIRGRDGEYAPLPTAVEEEVPSPDGHWYARELSLRGDYTTTTSLVVVNRRTGERQAIATRGFDVSPGWAALWSASGRRLFVSAVRYDQTIGFAYGDAPAFRLHLVLVPHAQFDWPFVPVPDGSGVIDNPVLGTRPASRTSGPLRFTSVTGSPTAHLPGTQVSPGTANPFSPSGRLLLALCGTGQCVLNAATGQVVSRIPVLSDGGNPAYPAQDVGWYDDSHFLSWIAAISGSGYQLVTVSLTGLVTGILATNDSPYVPRLYLAPPAR
ncbi:MAG: hypothetical protein M3Y33_09000 [Actinomycetota bacterium]|nr:hypothetical protein [Actinomycetota bacterium]